jgi:glycosyltransferase involved in cell wall biosynthesis
LEVLVLPSLHEGSPLVILEAISAGVPIVASAVGGIPDQVEHGREGILVQPGDPSALGDAILRLLRDPALASRLGEAGRQRAGSRFSYAAMVQRVEAVYGAVLVRSGVQGATSVSKNLESIDD